VPPTTPNCQVVDSHKPFPLASAAGLQGNRGHLVTGRARIAHWPRQAKRSRQNAGDVRGRLPSVDRLLSDAEAASLIDRYGRERVKAALRAELAQLRSDPRPGGIEHILQACSDQLRRDFAASLVPVFNLTGTVLHTNFGRAPLPDEAVAAAAQAFAAPMNLEYDLSSGRRGERDDHVRAWLCRLTGAESATVVNNNAGAVLIVANTLARRREVVVSRGELVEIGGSFRIPEIIASAGCRLREIGTTNRTRIADYDSAISSRTALLLKVHPSNYEIRGFTESATYAEVAMLASSRGLPFAVDLGSGTLVDLARFGLPREPTVSETITAGADLVTFSGDKLLGGPQSGVIVGRAHLIARINRNPLKRALRLDKARLAALAAILSLYANPDRLCERLPGLRLMKRSEAELEEVGRRVESKIAAALGPAWIVEVRPSSSQIGSGALPAAQLPSRSLDIRPARRGGLTRLAEALRALPVPVIGRIHEGRLRLDLRCLEDETAFLSQLPLLRLNQ
jgi:L-seryl-tRNA(Ser) seleniumtransferase